MTAKCDCPLYVLAFGLATALAAPPAFAQAAKSAPEAADMTLGMALMSAIVDAEGNLVSGAGAVSARKVNDQGFFEVFFQRTVGNCTSVASVGGASYVSTIGHGMAETYNVANIGGGTGITVLTRDQSGVPVKRDFQVIVFCAK